MRVLERPKFQEQGENNIKVAAGHDTESGNDHKRVQTQHLLVGLGLNTSRCLAKWQDKVSGP